MFDKKVYMRDYYKNHKKDYQKWHHSYYESEKEKVDARNKDLRERKRLECLVHYGGNPPICSCCGEKYLEFLTIDHIHGGGSRQRRSLGLTGSFFYYWLIKHNFPKGYRVLCYNCNCSLGFNKYCPHRKEVLDDAKE